jgi:flagellar basal body rod protein FlgB
MSLFQTELFDVAEKRLVWAGERQAVLARNIANLSTPGFQASDTPDFQQTLAGSTGIQPVRTDPAHMARARSIPACPRGRRRRRRPRTIMAFGWRSS